jgi:hypothetical protein
LKSSKGTLFSRTEYRTVEYLTVVTGSITHQDTDSFENSLSRFGMEGCPCYCLIENLLPTAKAKPLNSFRRQRLAL